MKLFHLADLHLGKRVNGFSMIEDQKYILARILDAVREEQPDAVLIAGDVYDRAVPSEEAIELFDQFLVDLTTAQVQVYVISGNHDSAERVSYGGRLMEASGLHIAPVYKGKIEPFKLEDTHGTVNFWLIPFLKPSHVRHFYPEAAIASYTDAMRVVIENMNLDPTIRNVALSHQFITGSTVSDSEDLHMVGGLDEVEAAVFEPFDYVALGHLHGPQAAGYEKVRYSGSPLKYSFSEVNQKKAITVVELGEKDELKVREIPLKPLHDMIRIRGSFAELMESTAPKYDYYEITLTDEEDVPNAMVRLTELYSNLMAMKYDNTRTRTESKINEVGDSREKQPIELFRELFEIQNGKPLDEAQEAYMQQLILHLQEEDR